jgi:methylenetetrahydrofolate reductase (NADPH)
MPVTNYAQIRRIASLCKARLPESFTRAFEAAGDDEAAQFEAGVEFATRQVEELLDAGVPGIHFYVLNKSPATVRVLEQVDLQGARAEAGPHIGQIRFPRSTLAAAGRRPCC